MQSQLARIAPWVGAIGSVVLLFVAAKRTPPLLLAIFTLWVLSPYIAWFWTAVWRRRPAMKRTALNGAMLLVAPVSLALYTIAAFNLPRPASMFVVVPPVSWLVMAIAAIASRR